ncbi:MAG: glycosyltransferase family 2 protein [Chloroflexaceae bacterium]|nr:glycosyltransferase family 2 protein [Chloroflexaceae bacterium]
MTPSHAIQFDSANDHTDDLGMLLAHTSGARPRITVLIPALNEAECLPHVLRAIPSWVDEVIVADGNSTDATVAAAQLALPTVIVVQQEGRGKGAAIRTGFTHATGDIIVLLDADGSMDPAELPHFIGPLLAGADFAKGSRFLHGAGTNDMPRYRQAGNWALVTLTNLLFRTNYSDITYGYNAFWRYYGPALALDIDSWASEIISNIRAARNGLKVVEVPSFEHPRIAGEAKLQAFRAGWTILKAILRERFVGQRTAIRRLARPVAAVPAAPAAPPLKARMWGGNSTEGDALAVREL